MQIQIHYVWVEPRVLYFFFFFNSVFLVSSQMRPRLLVLKLYFEQKGYSWNQCLGFLEIITVTSIMLYIRDYFRHHHKTVPSVILCCHCSLAIPTSWPFPSSVNSPTLSIAFYSASFYSCSLIKKLPCVNSLISESSFVCLALT